jgi:hypothetical protein
VSNVGRSSFLQGGTGWLISRAAVRNFLQIAPAWFEATNSAEDAYFTVAMERIALSVRNSTSPYFLGQYCHPDDLELMEKFNFSKLVKCPSPGRIVCRDCKSFRKIVFFHRLSMLRLRMPPNPMSRYPENLGWYMCGEFPHLCKME